MKNPFGWVMLLSITMAASVSAQELGAFAGLGSQRGTLSALEIQTRSERLETSTTFSLLRYPGALQAPARIFEPAMWRIIESAAREHGLDAMLLAGMIFIESYGDPLAKSPTGPAGIAQLTKSSAKELGLSTARKVRVGSKAVTKTRVVGKGKTRRKIVQTRHVPVYRTIDERFQPDRAIRAMARRVSTRRAWLGGKVDFAVAEYHMGAGRMARLLSSYFDRAIPVSGVPRQMQASGLTYAELFWTNTPYVRPAVYKALDDLNNVDYSPTYYFRVRQAMRLLETYRKSPPEYSRLAATYRGRLGQTVLPNWQWSFVTEPDPSLRVRSAAEFGRELGQRFVPFPAVASDFGVRPLPSVPALAGERSTIGSALFVAHQLRRLQGDRYEGFAIASMLTHEGEEDENLPIHSLGWAFDVDTSAMSTSAKRDLRFVLADLRHAGLLAFTEDTESGRHRYHVVRHPNHAAEFEQFYWDVMARADQ